MRVRIQRNSTRRGGETAAHYLMSAVPNGSLLHILRREHVEDIHRIAGIGRETHRAREAIKAPPLRRVRHRLPWLLLGLAGSMLATFVMSRFEQALSGKVAIAFFIPGLVYLADAIATQTEAVAVRGLSLSPASLAKLIGSELRTGLLIGLILGTITFPAVWLTFGDSRLAVAVDPWRSCSRGAWPPPSACSCPGCRRAWGATRRTAAGRWPPSSRTS